MCTHDRPALDWPSLTCCFPEQNAWTEVAAQRIKGSTTAVVAALCGKTRVLSTANLGDSGFVLYRDGQAL
jgi:serine/threonine protein phosphatase PrpC